MLNFCTFRNTHPPALAEIWRSQASQRGVLQPISVDLLEQFVFAKPYFDYEGLMVAFDGDRAVGFAHAAFGPDESCCRISTDTGVTCMLMVCPDSDVQAVAAGLLERSEDYLRRRGAKIMYGGGVVPANPFYVGLYGGCDLPGVLDTDTVAQALYHSQGYEESDKTLIFVRDLDGFRPPVDRQQMQYRRRLTIEVQADPPAHSWWEACTTGEFDLTRFEFSERGQAEPLASVTIRSMRPNWTLATGMAAGLMDVRVLPSHRQNGLGTFALAESMRRIAEAGVVDFEAHASEANLAGRRLLKKLGFEQMGQASVFRKTID